ncbi:unnamed protein product [Protopolystoma xenopodis]|uniref:Uncharacterized protein n=1 Tax=Protopolystoma xenopodis TaxID=117903 RepID=A0A448WB01_9PLAT|nr:unnamed protein product [Protopolystoma xenopodis]
MLSYYLLLFKLYYALALSISDSPLILFLLGAYLMTTCFLCPSSAAALIQSVHKTAVITPILLSTLQSYEAGGSTEAGDTETRTSLAAERQRLSETFGSESICILVSKILIS